MMRLMMSRPKLSVPAQWAALGGASGLPTPWASGSYGESTGAKTAIAMIARNTARPNTAPGLRAKRRHQRPRTTRVPRAASGAVPGAGTVKPSELKGRPVAPRGRATLLRHPDPGVQEGVGEIHEQVHQDDREDSQEDGALHHRVVPVQDGGHG